MKGQEKKKKKAKRQGEERRELKGDDETGKKRKRERLQGKQARKGRRPDTGKGEIEEARWEEDSQRRGCGTGRDGEKDEI